MGEKLMLLYGVPGVELVQCTTNCKSIGVDEAVWFPEPEESTKLRFMSVLKFWRHSLLSSRFEAFNNHKSVNYLFDQKELNMGQRICLQFMKDYNFGLNYHSGKVNVVVIALSKKSFHMSMLVIRELELIEKFKYMSLVCEETPISVKLGMLKLTSGIPEEI